tara:strand:+ start:791 stop:1051 length:261 start_codon:yes stop_codon:yes gene_type:complete
MKERVIIKVREKDENGERLKFSSDVRGGEYYISVDFNAKHYGMGSPCSNDEDADSSIKHAEDWIRKEGDIPILDDRREKNTLSNFF